MANMKKHDKEKDYSDKWENEKLNIKRNNGIITEIFINKISEDEILLIDNISYNVRLKILVERDLRGYYVNSQHLIERNKLQVTKDLENFLNKLNYEM